MTVCIAAICRFLGQPLVMGISDRMLTSGDIQFEPPQQKIYPITNSIYAMIAGDAAIHGEIYPKVFARVGERITKFPKEWVKVENAARIYGDEVAQYKKRIVQRLVLDPLGLTWDTFISKQREMSREWLEDVTDRILELKPSMKTIVTGLDELGPHIWVVDGNGKPSCADTVGFAAIGYGQRHAESEFMFGGHTPNSPFPETWLRLYTAKKRAEAAPGVGKLTDILGVPLLGQGQIGYAEDSANVAETESIYREMMAKINIAKQEADLRITKTFEDQLKKMQAAKVAPSEQSQEPPTPPASPSPPSNSGTSEPKK